MTAAVLTQLPLAAGSAFATTLGRTARWGLARYARAPLSNTAVLALAAFSLMSASNALYFQSHRHPAPLFGEPQQELGELAPVPAAPVVRPKARPRALPVQTTGSVPAAKAVVPNDEPIGNADVSELQRKLQAFGIFDGTIDGLYGPKTARAIRTFEEQQGLKPKGELTRDILTAILAAPLVRSPAAAPVLTAPEPVPEPTVVMTETVPAVAAPNAMAQPLPAPTPLQPTIQTASSGRPPVTDRPLPETPEEALEIASGVAANAVDALVAVVHGDVQLGPATQPLPPKAKPMEPAMQPASPAAAPGSDPVAAIVTAEMPPVATVPVRESKDPALVSKVQRGLASLGFLSGEIDGKPGEATAKAIRNFEVWNNYEVTGQVTPQLLDLLVAAGAET